jgi:hypothetical protein
LTDAGVISASPLDLVKGIDTPESDRAICERWPEDARLLRLDTLDLIRGRCKATNLCPFCQRLYVRETIEMWSLDAAEFAPNLWGVLTAREHLTRSECRRHLDKLLRAARRRWPAIQWAVSVEFQRRGALHLNLVIKAVPTEDLVALRELLIGVWCERVDALPVGQWFGAIDQAEGVIRYVQKTLAHGLKAEQSPPLGWRGHRTSQTRGYLVRPASVMRAEARRSLALKAKIAHGQQLEEALAEAERDAAASWQRVSLTSMEKARENIEKLAELVRLVEGWYERHPEDRPCSA